MVERDRGVSFGIAYLDNLSRGSMKPGSMGLLLGPAGTGKSALAVHFLFDGAASGENVCLITNEPPETVVEHLSMFKTYNPNWTREGYLSIFSIADLSALIGVSPENPTCEELGLIYDLITELLDQLDLARLSLDPGNPIINQVDNVGMLSFFRGLKRKLKDKGTTALLTYDTFRPVSDWEMRCIQPDMLDVLIKFARERGPALNINTLSIERFKGRPHSKRTYIVDVSNDGVTLVPRIEFPEVK